jgi:hypothetical protein
VNPVCAVTELGVPHGGCGAGGQRAVTGVWLTQRHDDLLLLRVMPQRGGHYARTLKRRCALTKKGDAWSARLRRCVMHYNIIGDTCKCTSLISQYRRCALQTLVSHHVEKLRCAIRVARLILDDCLSYSGTNKRRMFSEAHLRLSYAPSEFLQAAGCILELTRIRQPHSTCKSHIFTFTYKGTYG